MHKAKLRCGPERRSKEAGDGMRDAVITMAVRSPLGKRNGLAAMLAVARLGA